MFFPPVLMPKGIQPNQLQLTQIQHFARWIPGMLFVLLPARH
ncbi:hypothetical protein BN18_4522 [Klebsiella pneumoniae subsp. pneumoniae ST512-K30BO]|nr:hypothetical protein CSC00_0008 [Klebsiella pneumoniae]CCM85849.1 hypothetical protein BN426_5359 [Klebsiella pneumoniae subsp. pneumoniae ST258-K26BO]CCM87665.1 hypothetical protein BN427_1544 [Klebsiella pneumoniae subsp. pneumoniae ST258-K28BO]CCM96240.1 hypothetical protein BN18_4522 [Klebsiella pneumoniae subsp. pneumoniae ST512-K30BO]CDK91518.1 hypothetical protein [Klebsiella pneumoniae IS33]